MIAIGRLYECFEYDPYSGLLKWKSRPVDHFCSARYMRIFNVQFADLEAGTAREKGGSKNPYKSVSLTLSGRRKTLECHRIAFAMYHGYWPENVDHFDGDTLNNRISNLRPATKSLNGKNKNLAIHNTSGIPGVSRNGNGWIVYGAGKPKFYIGRFKSLFDAACARKGYELANGYTYRHGGIRQ